MDLADAVTTGTFAKPPHDDSALILCTGSGLLLKDN